MRVKKTQLAGFTLVEILIAITIFFIGVVGIFSLLADSINTASFSVDNFTASQLAQEGMEIVRNIRDQNWLNLADYSSGLSTCQAGCEIDYNDIAFVAYQASFLKIDINGFFNYQQGENSKFKRKIIITPQTDFLNVKVEVFWGQNNLYKTQDNLYDWYNAG